MKGLFIAFAFQLLVSLISVFSFAFAQERRLVTQDNLWFQGDPYYSNYKINGGSMIPITPLLGLTWSSDPAVKRQELQWLLRYTGQDGSGIVLSQEWIKPNDVIDVNLKSTFLPVLNQFGGTALWNVFYDPILAIEQRGLGSTVDYGNPEILSLWKSDIQYLKTNYFTHPAYWRLRGKPVLYVWNIAALRNANVAFDYARQQGVYILGDTLNPLVDDQSYMNSLPPMDGVTGFLITNGWIGNPPTTVGNSLDLFRYLFSRWNNETAARGLDFIPASSSQYDDTEFSALIGKTPLRILAENANQVKTHLGDALSAAPVIDAVKYVFWGTANNWAEGATLLPTKLDPPSEAFYVYRCSSGVCTERIGNYGFQILEAVKSVMFDSLPAYTGPSITVGTTRIVSETTQETRYSVDIWFENSDIMGSLSLVPGPGVTVTNTPNFVTLSNLSHQGKFRFLWQAAVTVKKPNPLLLDINFLNLDSKNVQARLGGAVSIPAAPSSLNLVASQN